MNSIIKEQLGAAAATAKKVKTSQDCMVSAGTELFGLRAESSSSPCVTPPSA